MSQMLAADIIQKALVLVKLQPPPPPISLLQLSNRSLLARLRLTTASVEARLVEDLEVVTMEGLGVQAVEVVEEVELRNAAP